MTRLPRLAPLVGRGHPDAAAAYELVDRSGLDASTLVAAILGPGTETVEHVRRRLRADFGRGDDATMLACLCNEQPTLVADHLRRLLAEQAAPQGRAGRVRRSSVRRAAAATG